MKNTSFINRNNDLLINFLAGASMVLLVNFFPFSVQSQFLMVLTFGFFSGIFMNHLYQSLEWAFFFFLGILSVAIFPDALRVTLGGTVHTVEFVRTGMQAVEYGAFLLSSWIISIPLGLLLQKLLRTDYLKRNTI